MSPGQVTAPENCPLVREPKGLPVSFHGADFWVFFSSAQNWGAACPGPLPEGLGGPCGLPTARPELCAAAE